MLNNTYICPICNNSIDKFLPLPDYYFEQLQKHGADGNLNNRETLNWEMYSCPQCGATDRERLYALYLDFRFRLGNAITNDLHLVDFAPSVPLSTFIRSIPGLIYKSVDIAMQGVDHLADIMELNIFQDETVDFFICSHVLEHVINDRKAISELFRILKPGGEGILMVPISLDAAEIDEDADETREDERWRRFGQFDHIRRYSKQGFIDRVLESGFKLTLYGVRSFGYETFERAGITKQSVLYIASKDSGLTKCKPPHLVQS